MNEDRGGGRSGRLMNHLKISSFFSLLLQVVVFISAHLMKSPPVYPTFSYRFGTPWAHVANLLHRSSNKCLAQWIRSSRNSCDLVHASPRFSPRRDTANHDYN